MTRADRTSERFERLAAAHGPRLMGYLLRRVAPDDAADVAAQSLLTAWRRVRVMPEDDEEAFWWLLGIARRTVANHRRGLVRRSALADRLRALPTEVTGPGFANPQGATQADTLGAALDALGESDRELVRLAYWEDLSPRAIAVALGISEATARKRLQRSRDKLRAALSQADADQTPVQVRTPAI